MKLLRFFIKHSLRDMWRNRARTVFALICVATGVTAVVALRSMAFMVGDELTTDLAEMNRGDIRLYASRGTPEIVTLSREGDPIFSAEGERAIREWAAEEGVTFSGARLNNISSVRVIENGTAGPPTLNLTLLIEPEHYPFYSEIILSEPAGVPLEDVFPPGSEAESVASVLLPKLGALSSVVMPRWNGAAGSTWATYPAYLIAHPRPVVISSNLTRQSSLGLSLGDYVRLGAPDTIYEVRGIAPATSESILTVPPTVFLDFLYAPLTDLPLLGDPALPEQIFIQVPLGRDIAAAEASLIRYLERTFPSRTNFDLNLNRESVPDLEENNDEAASVLDDMILVMGLSSLLIGGIGIINTMQVIVSRRTLEIAVLKTLGLKGSRITGLFMVEALLMGLLGSALGVVIGVALSYTIKSVGEEAFQLTLVWRLYPEAMLSGMFLGVVITVLFGFLPTLIAGQVRPAVVLRPNEAQMPAAGLLQTLATLIVMIVVLGLLVDTIVEGAIAIGPVYMITGGGALVGLFAGVIIANTGLGQPIPAYYRFRLPRRFERLQNAITGPVGILTGLLPVTAWRGMERHLRGQAAITLGLRGLRQLLLIYGSLAIGAALASLILLIGSEVWIPLGLGETKPAGHIVDAVEGGSARWVITWAALTLAIGLAIRLLSRALVGLVAMSTLGVTVGGLIGWLIGRAGALVLDGTGTWTFLAEISTGIVLVEAALAAMAAVFVGYWLLVWLVGRMSGGALMGLVSLVLVGLLAGAAQIVAGLGVGALLALGAVALIGGLVIGRTARSGEAARPLAEQPRAEEAGGIPAAPTLRLPGTSLLMMSMAGLVGGLLLVDVGGERLWWAGAGLALLVFAGLWRALRRRYKVDGRLVLREMASRRSRVASTLLGLSVGLAGLSLVSLTTGAATHLLETQMSGRIEGNLLVIARVPDQVETIEAALAGSEGVEAYSSYRIYSAALLAINGETVSPTFHSPEDEPGGMGGNGRATQGFPLMLAQRGSLADLPEYEMSAGRQLEPSDAGEHVIMLRESFITQELGIEVGDRLMLLFENGVSQADDVMLRLTVIGLVDSQSALTGYADQFLVPPDTLPGTVKPMNMMTVARVDESDDAYMDGALVALSNIPGVFAIELSALTQLLESLINQFKALPTLVAWLALISGTAIIANTVALATQERRRQIGVMKAVGLKGRRVLAMLMIENGLIGLIAGLIGIAVGLLLTVVLVLASPGPDQLMDALEMETMGWLLVMSIAVAIGAATLSAWSAAAEKPMNVLRYE